MGGTVNSMAMGLYANIEPIIPGVSGFTMAFQQALVPSCQQATFENSVIDTKAATHPTTIPIPGIPGLITGTTAFPAQEVLRSSSIFSINHSAVNCSDALKLQNLGNCPISPMTISTGSTARFFVSN